MELVVKNFVKATLFTKEFTKKLFSRKNIGEREIHVLKINHIAFHTVKNAMIYFHVKMAN